MTANILASIFGNIIDKEGEVKKIITEALKNSLVELNKERSDDEKYTANNIFIMIKPCSDKMDFKLHLYLNANGKQSPVKELTLKEILGSD